MQISFVICCFSTGLCIRNFGQTHCLFCQKRTPDCSTDLRRASVHTSTSTANHISQPECPSPWCCMSATLRLISPAAWFSHKIDQRLFWLFSAYISCGHPVSTPQFIEKETSPIGLVTEKLMSPAKIFEPNFFQLKTFYDKKDIRSPL